MNENNVGSISTRQMELRNGGTFNLFIYSFFFSFPTMIRGERERERGWMGKKTKVQSGFVQSGFLAPPGFPNSI